MNVAVLVPRRADHGRRDQVWAWLKNRWAAELPDWGVYEGHDNADRPFSRSAAINSAADLAGDWDVAVIADADSFVSTTALLEAVEVATTSGTEFVLCYDLFNYLNRRMSDQIMGGYLGMWETGVEWSMPGTCSSMIVVTRRLWDEVRGFDERFVGWGFEDVGFSHACQTFGNGLRRIEGPVWHLWHPASTENSHQSPVWHTNRDLAERYHEAAYDRDRMAKLIAER